MGSPQHQVAFLLAISHNLVANILSLRNGDLNSWIVGVSVNSSIQYCNTLDLMQHENTPATKLSRKKHIDIYFMTYFLNKNTLLMVLQKALSLLSNLLYKECSLNGLGKIPIDQLIGNDIEEKRKRASPL